MAGIFTAGVIVMLKRKIEVGGMANEQNLIPIEQVNSRRSREEH